MGADESEVGTRNLDEKFDSRLKALGFDPGKPVYEVAPTFDFDAVQHALFRSRYDALPTLLFVVGDTSAYDIPVVVGLVQVSYLQQEVFLTERAIACWRQPDYYIRGFVQQSAFDVDRRPIVVHALVQMNSSDDKPTIDLVYLQIVREPTTASPDTPLRWGTEDEITR